MLKGAGVLDVSAVVFELEIPIDAPRERVWNALVEETNAWWLPDFHMVGEGSMVTFETEAGGRLLERRSDGASLLWYVVQWCKPGEFVYLNSPISSEWGGPAGTVLKLSIAEAQGGRSTLTVTQELYGHVADETVESLESGWRQLFTDGLKTFVEQGVRRD